MKTLLLASLSLLVSFACDKQGTAESEVEAPGPVVVAESPPPDDPVVASGLKWFTSCGDPVCSGYGGPWPGVPSCDGIKEGQACTSEGSTCDFQSGCNARMVCAKEDPKLPGCPRSRARFKKDIAYLDATELDRYYLELRELKLATWRYRDADERVRLGVILEDGEPDAVWADPAHDRVDLYGYASLAVAGVQAQAREIEELQASLATLHRELDELRTHCGR
jgi:hypothetical protein